MRKLSTATAVAALCVLGTAASAEAAGKDRIVVERFSNTYELTVDCQPFGPYDFDVLVSGREHVTVTDVVADDGTLLQTVVQVRFTESNTNSESGATVPLKRSAREVWDWGEGTRTITGAVLVGTKRGGGTWVQDTGLLTLTIDTDEPVVVAGPHEAFFGGGIDAIGCAALAEV
jgi:hypothetical protein